MHTLTSIFFWLLLKVLSILLIGPVIIARCVVESAQASCFAAKLEWRAFMRNMRASRR